MFMQKRLCEVDNSTSIEEKKIDLPKSARKARNITLNRDGEEELATDVFLTFERSQPAKDFAFEQVWLDVHVSRFNGNFLEDNYSDSTNIVVGIGE
jgi:hypothetical protein